jgi:hypothetical protein
VEVARPSELFFAVTKPYSSASDPPLKTGVEEILGAIEVHRRCAGEAGLVVALGTCLEQRLRTHCELCEVVGSKSVDLAAHLP